MNFSSLFGCLFFFLLWLQPLDGKIVSYLFAVVAASKRMVGPRLSPASFCKVFQTRHQFLLCFANSRRKSSYLYRGCLPRRTSIYTVCHIFICYCISRMPYFVGSFDTFDSIFRNPPFGSFDTIGSCGYSFFGGKKRASFFLASSWACGFLAREESNETARPSVETTPTTSRRL